jgi:CheY-like chemotaxis protein
MGGQKSIGVPDGTIRKKRFILVADNDQRDANYTSMLLQNLGYNATIVRSGEEALEFKSIAAPALVITELMLPGMNGMDLFERFAHDPAVRAVPVIIQTKFADQDSEDRCRRAGCAGCLNKPVQTFELFRAVQQALEPTPRQNIRIATFLNASLEGGTSGTQFVTMLSDSGLFLRSLEPLPAGSLRAVTFVLDDRVIRVDGEVLYAYRFDEGPGKEPGMGMRFLNLSPVDHDVIQAYINERVAPGFALNDPS